MTTHGNDRRKLKFQQMVTFVVLFIGYTFYILDRKSFAFNIPNIKQAENVNSESIGSVISSLALGYAIGKFVGGILVDTVSPKYLFSFGLVICGTLNFAFSASSSTSVYMLLWFANGVFQGAGWPSCAKLLRNWYSPTVFGTLWSILSASMNIAASAGPFICNVLMDNYGSWRYSMILFAILSYIAAALILLFVHDTPKAYGFATDDIRKLSTENSPNTEKDKENDVTPPFVAKPSLSAAILRIVMSPFVYVMSFAFLASLLCKGVVSDWGPLYLITEKNATRTMASTFTGSVEMGGLLGALLSGMITDWLMLRASDKLRGHPRNMYLIPCVAILAGSLTLLRTSITNVPEQYFQTIVLGFVIGYTLYSLISIVGVMTMEKSAKDLSGTSHAVAALFGNVGLTLSGLPFTVVVETYSWNTSFFLIECCLVAWAVVAALSQTMVCRIGDLKRKAE